MLCRCLLYPMHDEIQILGIVVGSSFRHAVGLHWQQKQLTHDVATKTTSNNLDIAEARRVFPPPAGRPHLHYQSLLVAFCVTYWC